MGTSLRTRDSQKSKVYAAERAAFGHDGNGDLTLAQCQALVNKIATSKYVITKYPRYSRYASGHIRDQIRVVPGRRGGYAAKDGFDRENWVSRPIIALGLWARRDWIVIHEIAHLYSASTTGGSHGWGFTSVYLDLIRHFLGKEAHDKLKASFKAHGVKYTKPRPKREISPEQREALVVRLAAARAAKASTAKPKVERKTVTAKVVWDGHWNARQHVAIRKSNGWRTACTDRSIPRAQFAPRDETISPKYFCPECRVRVESGEVELAVVL